jgi:hypothetical protein
MKKVHMLWLFVFGYTFVSAQQFAPQEELLESIEIRAYIQQDQLPQFKPNDCPALEKVIDADALASSVVSTLMYQLIDFWGEAAVEGAESINGSDDVVYWKVIKTDNANYEAVLKTENIRLGKRIYQHLEMQQEQACFNWALVFSNEEIAAVEESSEAELVVERDFEKPDSYDVYDPYVGAYISEFGNPNAPNDLAIADELPPQTTSFEFGSRDMETAPDSYSNTNRYDNRTTVSNSSAPAFSSMMPAASAELNLPADFFSGLETVGDVERRIAEVLETRGYTNKGYFEFDNGFMIATQMEGISSSGAPKAAQYRFPSRIVFNQSLTFQNYINSLFLPERSKYRMFVFYVEAAPDRAYRDFNEIDYSVADSRNFGNDNRRSPLPESIASLPYRHKSNFDANVKVLVYETQTGANNRRPSVLSNPTLSAREHLTRSGLWNWFGER